MSRHGVLRVVSTPIGNLEDVTLRALRVLGEASFIACEDTRTTRKLLARHAITTPLVSCHEHNEQRRSGEIVAALERGEDVALTTDAGTPGVSDPGRRVVAAVLAAGLRVEPIPGPSAALAALVASGLPSERFTFLGFLPRKGRERRAALADALELDGSVILYEAPHRVTRTLAELAALAPEREASLHRELTKLHEESRRGTLAELAAASAARPARGEYTLVIAGREPEPEPHASVDEAAAEARRLVAAGRSPRDAAREAATRGGVSRRLVYGRLLGGDDEE